MACGAPRQCRNDPACRPARAGTADRPGSANPRIRIGDVGPEDAKCDQPRHVDEETEDRPAVSSSMSTPHRRFSSRYLTRLSSRESSSASPSPQRGASRQRHFECRTESNIPASRSAPDRCRASRPTSPPDPRHNARISPKAESVECTCTRALVTSASSLRLTPSSLAAAPLSSR